MAERRALVLDSNGNIVETPTGDTIYGAGGVLSWQPPQIQLYAIATSGAIYAFNTGVGMYISMSGGAFDNKIIFNLYLKDGNGINYDGSTIKINIHCRISSNGVAGNTVGLILDYAFIKVGDNSMTKVTNVAQQNVNVSSRLQDIEFEISLADMTGVALDDTLQVGITRNSNGGSADTYPGNLRITAIEILKV